MPQCVRCQIIYNEKYNNQCPRCGLIPASTTATAEGSPPGVGQVYIPLGS